jgi:Mg2+ and Co2+ transporter CorA
MHNFIHITDNFSLLILSKVALVAERDKKKQSKFEEENYPVWLNLISPHLLKQRKCQLQTFIFRTNLQDNKVWIFTPLSCTIINNKAEMLAPLRERLIP